MKDKKLTPAAKLLYGEIRALEQCKYGLCVASTDRLARDLGVGNRTVDRALNQLEEAGLIRRKTEGKKKCITTIEWSDGWVNPHPQVRQNGALSTSK